MGFIPLTVATLMYVWAAADFYFLKGDVAMAVVYGAYALANVGLIVVAYRGV